MDCLAPERCACTCTPSLPTRERNCHPPSGHRASACFGFHRVCAADTVDLRVAAASEAQAAPRAEAPLNARTDALG